MQVVYHSIVSTHMVRVLTNIIKREADNCPIYIQEEYTMTLRPMADNVLLKQNEANETTVGGIILATATKEKPAIYAVVAVGPGTKDTEMLVKVGDKVVVSKHVGTDVTLDKVDYKFVKQDEILAVVE